MFRIVVDNRSLKFFIVGFSGKINFVVDPAIIFKVVVNGFSGLFGIQSKPFSVLLTPWRDMIEHHM